MITYTQGNLLNVKEGIIAHGVNCQGAFGAGVAGQIRKRFPGVYTAYVHKYQKFGWKLGDVQLIDLVAPGEEPIIANCATQNGYGYTDSQTVFVDYDAIKKVFTFLIDYCWEHSLKLSIPKIGAGLAGGDWNKIEAIINECNKEKNVDITVYYL